MSPGTIFVQKLAPVSPGIFKKKEIIRIILIQKVRSLLKNCKFKNGEYGRQGTDGKQNRKRKKEEEKKIENIEKEIQIKYNM